MFLNTVDVYTSARGLANTKGTGGVLSEHPNLRGGGSKKKSKQRVKKGSRARKNEEEEENN